MGVLVWPMVDLEADDALGAAARIASADPRVERVYICTPDKDLAQCVAGGRVLQMDRRNRVVIDEAGVVAKFGVGPGSIPDLLALVGDTADGYPGIAGWGRKSAATVLARYARLEAIPPLAHHWDIDVRGADRLARALDAERPLALLFRDLATLRVDAPILGSVDELCWRGSHRAIRRDRQGARGPPARRAGPRPRRAPTVRVSPPPLDFVGLLAALTAIYIASKALGELMERFHQPAVLGELIAGVLLGGSVLALIDPETHVLHILAELGVLILLFEIGLESKLGDLLRVGPQSIAVALAGMVLPLLLGWGVATALGLHSATAIYTGAALTATSIGITARILADMVMLESNEARIIIGAAVVDDILGLVVLGLVKGLAESGSVGAAAALRMTLLAIGFFVLAVLLGRLAAPWLVRAVSRMRVRGVLLVSCLSFAFLLALAAHAVGSATIVGAFAAGLVLAQTSRREEIEAGVRPLSDFFVPIFFATVGAAVDIRFFDPFDPARRRTLLIAGLLLAAALAGKGFSGLFAFKKGARLRRAAIGAGMIPAARWDSSSRGSDSPPES
jgi:Kef-type K+ transport system membrane component KefB